MIDRREFCHHPGVDECEGEDVIPSPIGPGDDHDVARVEVHV